MRHVIVAFKRMDAEKRIPVIRLEVDYELLVLYDALKSGDELQIANSKEQLEMLRQEMIRLEI